MRWQLACAIVLTLSSCAHGRSAAELRSTALGEMPPPPGSALAWETYTPASFGVDGPHCAHLERVYASNDVDAFSTAVVRVATDHHAKQLNVPDRPVFNQDSPGSPSISASGVNGTRVTVDFHDIDAPAYRIPSWIDARAWRYVIVLRVWDGYTNQGGGCGQ